MSTIESYEQAKATCAIELGYPGSGQPVILFLIDKIEELESRFNDLEKKFLVHSHTQPKQPDFQQKGR